MVPIRRPLRVLGALMGAAGIGLWCAVRGRSRLAKHPHGNDGETGARFLGMDVTRSLFDLYPSKHREKWFH